MRLFRIARFRFTAATLLFIAAAAATWAASGADRSWMMPASELKAGMKGYGLTVFKGDTPTTFKAEIIGVRHNAIGAGVDMILARLDHPVLRDIGVIAGMSGSPVFINGRLIGAVAYGYNYSKVAIAGITPIEKMLEVYERTGMKPPPRDVALGPMERITLGEPVSFEPKIDAPFADRPVIVRAGDLAPSVRAFFDTPDEEITLKPLPTPLVVSSCSPATARLIERIFKPLGVEPIFAAVGASADAADKVSTASLVNGSAMGVPYLMGDLSMAVIGTATYVHGNKMVAFGHPLDGRGPVVFPVGIAHIFTCIPSRMRPFKLGEITALSGSLYQDRLPAVGCAIGPVPYMVPMTVKVVNETEKTERTFHYKLVDNRLLSPRMASIALVESCTAAAHSGGEMTASMKYTIETDDGRVIKQHSMASSTMAPDSLALDILNDVAPIYSNEFQVRSVKRIAAEVHLRNGVKSARLQSAFADRTIAKPGQTIRVSAYIKPWRRPQRRIVMEVRVPRDLEDGDYNLVVCDSSRREAAELARAPGLYKPRNFAELVRLIDLQFDPDRLYVMITSPERGLTIDGREFASLPPSIQLALTRLHDREKISPTIGQIVTETSMPLPFVVTGNQIISIKVDRRGGR